MRPPADLVAPSAVLVRPARPGRAHARLDVRSGSVHEGRLARHSRRSYGELHGMLMARWIGDDPEGRAGGGRDAG